MKPSRFTYVMNVPRDAEQVRNADGYFEEMSNVESFELTKEEFDYLDFRNGMLDAFNKEFNLIIMECEEDRIEAEDIDKALDIAVEYSKKASTEMELSAVNKVLAALRFAKEKGTFLEFDNDIAVEYSKKASTEMEHSAVNKVLTALRFAKEKGTFLEFDNPPNPNG